MILPRHWRSKPPTGAAHIDWGHPLSRGLVFCALFNEGSGISSMDLVRRPMGAFVSAPIWHGDRLEFDGTDDCVSWANADVPDAPFLGDISLIWRGTIDTAGSYRHFAGKHTVNGTSGDNPFDFRTNDGTPLELRLVRGGTEAVPSTGAQPTVGVEEQYAVTHVPGAVVKFYVNKNTWDSSGTLNFSGAGEAAPLRVGSRADDFVRMDGKAKYFYAYSRALSEQEIHALYDNPYQFLRPLPQRYWDVPAAAGGGGFKAAWARNNTVLGAGVVL